MNQITKVSDITYQDVADYIRLDELDGSDASTLNTLIEVSKTFIKNYTGRTMEELDNYQDFVIVVFILCQDMWDNRTLYVDKTNLNFAIESILGMHSVNLLPNEADGKECPKVDISQDATSGVVTIRGQS
jgi:hypothetical protein